ncbi:hypothetical protein [Paenibacillus dendritiformis]|nr:hypothetical protein [Paenibacillus dendritiformis]
MSPLPKLLQNGMNVSHGHSMKGKIAANDVLLQELHQITAEIA